MQYKQCFIFIHFNISHVNCFIPINNLQFYNCIPTIFKCTIVFPQFQGLQCDWPDIVGSPEFLCHVAF